MFALTLILNKMILQSYASATLFKFLLCLSFHRQSLEVNEIEEK